MGVRAAHNGAPLSEAMVFGISGGIGFAYFTMTYEGHMTTLYIGTAHRYKTKFGEFMVPFFVRTGLNTTVKTSSTANAAEKALLQALQSGRPVIAHTDAGLLTDDLSNRCYADHALVVTSYDEQEETYVVADRPRVPLVVSRTALQQARGSVKAMKHRICTVEAPDSPLDLTAAVRAGITACCEQLRHPPSPKGNFGLAGMKKWAAMLYDPKNKSGWPTLFPAGVPLLNALRTMFQWIEIMHSGRGGLRGLYADFLREAAIVLNTPELAEVAARYDRLEQLWTATAEAALPDDVPLLGELKRIERRKHEVFREQGMAAVDELMQLEAEAQAIKSQAAQDFPLDEAACRELLAHLQGRVEEIVREEEAAVTALEQAMMITTLEA